MLQNKKDYETPTPYDDGEVEDLRYNFVEDEEEKKIEENVLQLQRQKEQEHQSQQKNKFQNENDVSKMILTLYVTTQTKNNIENALDHYRRLLNLSQQLTMHFNSNEIYQSKYIQLSKQCIIGQMQILSLVEIINSNTDHKSQIDINQRYFALGKYQIMSRNLDQINFNMLNLTLEFMINEVFQPQEKVCDRILIKHEEEKYLIREFKVHLSKLHTLLEVFPFSLAVDRQDIFSLERNHPDWIQLFQKVTFKVTSGFHFYLKTLGTPYELKVAYEKLMQGMMVANAALAKSNEYKNSFVKNMVSSFGAIYYMANSQQGMIKAKEFIADPQKEDAFKVWNLGEQGMLKQLMPLIFPSIKFNKKIYINRYFLEISPEYIKNQYKDHTINKINNNIQLANYYNLTLPTQAELLTESKDNSKICVRILCHELLEANEGYNNFNKGQLGNFPVEKKSNFLQKMFQKPPAKVYDKIIIHIHGGGFVSMSSRTHQTYTRKWANQLQVPIFSIDYRKAPEDPYPAGLNDCWQAYLWILNYIQFYFNIVPKQVVLVGDSAGGNLVCALTIQCIKAGVKVPDGILMAYPALYLKTNFFTPSLLISLDDALLPHTILRLCLESYVQDPEFDTDLDPLLSPSKASDEILRKFPRTRILAGTNDPLHDESWRLAQKLVKLKKDLYMIIYPGMPHGFLSFDCPQGMKGCDITVQDGKNILKSLLEQSPYEEQMHDYMNNIPNEADKWAQNQFVNP